MLLCTQWFMTRIQRENEKQEKKRRKTTYPKSSTTHQARPGHKTIDSYWFTGITMPSSFVKRIFILVLKSMWVNSIELDKSFHHEVVDKQEQTK